MNCLQGKVAVIRGGNSGGSCSAAQEFIAEGAWVVITDRSAKAVQGTIAQLGSQAAGVVPDAARLADIARPADQMQALHPRIDALFGHADAAHSAPLAQVDEVPHDSRFDIGCMR